jgi:hypothetical protein
MKKGLIILLALGLVATGAVLAGQETSYLETPEVTPRVISVNGQGEIIAEPDIAMIELGVQTEHADSGIAQRMNTGLMNQVMENLQSNAIDEKDIQTVRYSIYPINEWNPELQRSEPKGFRVENIVRVTIRDLENVGSVIDGVVDNGANSINSIQFALSDPETAYLQALELAVKNAQGKAGRIAEAANVTLGEPSRITEGYSSIATRSDMVMEAAAYGAKADMATSISGGELTIRASVSMDFNF